ncbi:MAG: Sir2 family NAD-dependent protein deacetylase [Myxococcota bacterium]|nr:Sir2 family NAD-dependent protein deacetylase [Myxococcota bacterium]
MDDPLDLVRCKLRAAQSILIMTGAGVSVPSGIPDFRSPHGVWTRIDPHLLSRQALYGSITKYREFWRVVLEIYRDIHTAKPNDVHAALRDLEEAGQVVGLVTQNVDGLHQQAGSERVVELHGHYRRCHCIDCGQSFSTRTVFERHTRTRSMPTCTVCTGRIRPDLVLFGDPIDEAQWQKAIRWTAQCDLCLVLGTSLEVHPAADLPKMCHRSNVPVILLSREMTASSSWIPLRVSSLLEDVAQSLTRHLR